MYKNEVLKKIDFKNIRVEGNFIGSSNTLIECSFENCELNKMHSPNCTFKNCTFKSIDFIAYTPFETLFEKCLFEQVSFFNCNPDGTLKGLCGKDTKIRGVLFKGCNFNEVTFENCNLIFSRFYETNKPPKIINCKFDGNCFDFEVQSIQKDPHLSFCEDILMALPKGTRLHEVFAIYVDKFKKKETSDKDYSKCIYEGSQFSDDELDMFDMASEKIEKKWKLF